jgi:Leucine-rich repeat (LRR) protein
MSSKIIGSFKFVNNCYSCTFLNQKLDDELIFEDHVFGKSDEDVEALFFTFCEFSYVPQGFSNFFPNLKLLSIFDTKIKGICRNDLKEYKKLQYLFMMKTDIKHIPVDLFADNPGLIRISFNGSQIKTIEPNAFDQLQHLKLLDLRDNPCIDMCFNSNEEQGNEQNMSVSLNRIKMEIYRHNLIMKKQKIDEQQREIERLKSELACNSQKKEVSCKFPQNIKIECSEISSKRPHKKSKKNFKAEPY